MWIIWMICGLIVIAVIGMSLLTTHKGYQYKHTIDPLPGEENEKREDRPENRDK